MHKCLRAERSCINVETEPRTYCCGGGVAAGDRGEKIWVGRQGGKKVFGSGWQKLGWQLGSDKIYLATSPQNFLSPHQNILLCHPQVIFCHLTSHNISLCHPFKNMAPQTQNILPCHLQINFDTHASNSFATPP